MKNICKNCKHYKEISIKEYEEWDVKKEKMVVLDKFKSKGTCDSDKFIYYGDENALDDRLSYFDYENYQASFEVGENFGCIHFNKLSK